LDSTASEPLGAAVARGLGSSKTTSADSPLGQGTFTAQVALTLYDGSGAIRALSDVPSPITGAALTGDATAVIQVQGLEGCSSTVTVTLRQDGTYAAVEHINGATITYDSRNSAPTSSVEQGLANLAGKIAGLAGAAGSDTGLASAAPTALSSLVAPGQSTEGLEVTVTDAKGVSRYVGGAGGEIYAYRSGGDVALETVTIDDGVTTDSVRLVDNSGTTTIDGDDLDGTTFALERTADGTETASVTSTGGAYDADAVTPAAFSATDAFGDTVDVKGAAQGALAIAITDEFGNTFTFNNGTDGLQAGLTAAVTVGGYSGTAKANVVAQDEATLKTGSIARAATALEADGTSGKADGTLSITLADDVVSTTAVDPVTLLQHTTASAGVSIKATAAGTLDVLGGAQGAVANGAQSDKGDLIEGGNAQSGEGAEVLEDGASRTIVNIDVQAEGYDERSPAEPKYSTTSDFGQVSVTAFGRQSDGFTSQEIDRIDDVVYVTSALL